MKRSKRTQTKKPQVVQPDEMALAREREETRRYWETESLKRPLLHGMCPHDGNNFCDYCLGGA